jgi:hypothetical protein
MDAFWLWAKGAWENLSADIIQDISGFIMVMGAEFLETAGVEKMGTFTVEKFTIRRVAHLCQSSFYTSSPCNIY